MIYTSYFAKLRNLPENIVPISISAKTPDWYSGLTYKKLAPTYNILMGWKNSQNINEYTEQYLDFILGRLSPHEVVNEIYQSSNIPTDKDIALVCYEKSDSFCHRHLVAKWLNEAGYAVKEF